MMKKGMLALVASGLIAFSTLAAEPKFADAEDAERYRQLTNELRCLVCQNQTIADSNADLAVDLREQVATFIREGRSNEEIITFLTDRYGDFVLYRPPVTQRTWLLWSGPFILLVIALLAMAMILRKRSRMPEDPDAQDVDQPADKTPQGNGKDS